MERGSTYPLYQTGLSISGSIYSGAGVGVGVGVGTAVGTGVEVGIAVGTGVEVGTAVGAGVSEGAAAGMEFSAAVEGRVGAAIVAAAVRAAQPNRNANPKRQIRIIKTCRKLLMKYSPDTYILGK